MTCHKIMYDFLKIYKFGCFLLAMKKNKFNYHHSLVHPSGRSAFMMLAISANELIFMSLKLVCVPTSTGVTNFRITKQVQRSISTTIQQLAKMSTKQIGNYLEWLFNFLVNVRAQDRDVVCPRAILCWILPLAEKLRNSREFCIIVVVISINIGQVEANLYRQMC